MMSQVEHQDQNTHPLENSRRVPDEDDVQLKNRAVCRLP